MLRINSILTFINADIILLGNFFDEVMTVSEQNNFWERVKIIVKNTPVWGLIILFIINKNKENYPLKDLIQIIKYLPYYFQLTNNKIRKQMIKEYFLN